MALADDIERCYAQGWSDGHPVVPPYGRLVDAMLGAMGWQALEVVATLDGIGLEIRAQNLAAAAVMAGCRPEYGRLLRALSLALFEPEFNLRGAAATTGGPGVLVIVSGPIVTELEFAHEANTFAPACRPNATVGRFAQLVMRFCGSAGGILAEQGTIGHPGRWAYLVAEHPVTVWGPYHTQRGLDRDASASAVTVMTAEGPNSVNNHYGEEAEQVLETIADCIRHLGATCWYWRAGCYLVAIAPDHMEVLGKRYAREELRARLFERIHRPMQELARAGRIPKNPMPRFLGDPDAKTRAPVREVEQIRLIETGAAGGKFSAVVPSWAGCLHPVTRIID